MVSSQLVRNTQTSHSDLASHVTESVIPTLGGGVLEQIGGQGDIALAVINAEVTRQALFIAYLDDFKLMMLVTFAALPLVLLMKKAKPAAGGQPVHMD